MTRSEYDAIDAVHYSAAKDLLRTGLHYQQALKDEHEGPTAGEEDKYAVGTLVHAMTLENKDLSQIFAIKPKGMSFATTKGKEWRAAQTLPILKEEDLNKVPNMAQAIIQHPKASAILHGCTDREYCLQAIMGGVPCKALLDGVGRDEEGRRGILDIKTVVDASPKYFSKRAFDYHYDLQAAWYSYLLGIVEGLGTPPWMSWIAVENSPPWAVACYTPNELMMESGMRKMGTIFETLNDCLLTGRWPGYSDEIIEIGPPHYRIRELQEPIMSIGNLAYEGYR